MRITAIVVLLLVLTATSALGQEESPFKPAGTVTFKPIDEMSGIAKSNTYEDVYWVFNDSGDTARLFAINGRGEIIKPPYSDQDKPWPGLEVLVAANVDWEDITIDGDTLYVADTGNNGNARRDLGVYMLQEPNPRATERMRPIKFLPVRYSEQTGFPGNLWHWDCEAVFASEGKLYFVTKHRVPGVFNSGEWGARLYRMDTHHSGRVNDLTLIDSRPDLALPTAAEVSPDGTKLALLTSFSLHVLSKPKDGDRWLSGEEVTIPLDQEMTKQAEAVCWDDNETIRITNEQREIYTISLDALAKPTAGPSITSAGVASIPKSQDRVGICFNPTGTQLLVGHRAVEGGLGLSGFTLFSTGDLSKVREFTLEGKGSLMPVFSRNGRYLAFGVPEHRDQIQVHVVDLSSGSESEQSVKYQRRGGDRAMHYRLPSVQAVSDDGTTVAIAVPEVPTEERPARPHLGSVMVYTLVKSEVLVDLRDCLVSGFGSPGPGVALADGRVVCYAIRSREGEDPACRLVVHDLAGKKIRSLPGLPSGRTPGFLLSRNGRWMVHGAPGGDVTRTWFDGREDDVLFSCEDQLGSVPQLELLTSANEWMIVAWSAECRVLCCCDTVKKERFDLPIGGELGVGRGLLGLSPHGRYAYVLHVYGATATIRTLDLWRHAEVGIPLVVPEGRAEMDPTGRFLATLTEDGESWKMELHRLR